jgi:hypothetical protein
VGVLKQWKAEHEEKRGKVRRGFSISHLTFLIEHFLSAHPLDWQPEGNWIGSRRQFG